MGMLLRRHTAIKQEPVAPVEQNEAQDITDTVEQEDTVDLAEGETVATAKTAPARGRKRR